jgi:hypothetical protein
MQCSPPIHVDDSLRWDHRILRDVRALYTRAERQLMAECAIRDALSRIEIKIVKALPGKRSSAEMEDERARKSTIQANAWPP